MINLEKLSQKVIDNLNDKQQVVFDPVVATAVAEGVISIITDLIKLLQACKKTPEQAIQVAFHPNEDQEATLKKAIRKYLGFWGNWWNGKKYFNAIIKTGQEISPQEMKEVYQDVKTLS